MAIASSGAVSLGDLQTEFGGVNPISIDEYYLNAAYVGSNNTGVPTSGTISLQDFYGAAANTLVTVTEANSSAWTEVVSSGRVAKGFGVNRVADTRNTGWFNVGSFGSRTPVTLNGATLQAIYYTAPHPSANGTYFYIICQGSLPHNHFNTVALSGLGTFSYANFAFYISSGSSVWKRTLSTNNSPAAAGTWNGSGVSTAYFT